MKLKYFFWTVPIINWTCKEKSGRKGAFGLIGFSYHRGPGKYSRGHNLGPYQYTIFSRINRWGISFEYKDEEVIWIWPWKRIYNRGCKFLGILSSGGFDSLIEIDKFWEDYYKRTGCQDGC
jgi:hypothetical protein